MKKVGEIAGAMSTINRIGECRELDGKVAYQLSGFRRRYNAIMQDVQAFEQGEIARLELTFAGKPTSLIHPKQNIDNLKEYLEKRAEFFSSEEVDIDIPVFKFEQLEPAGLSPDDINTLMDIGMIEDTSKSETPEGDKTKKE